MKRKKKNKSANARMTKHHTQRNKSMDANERKSMNQSKKTQKTYECL